MTLDLSRAFVSGFHGGSNAEYVAVASLVRTLGANLPEVKRVLLVCDGAPIATLGGHLPLDQPFDVQDWP
ncbi:MAG: GerMN domain-containing protein, partial [Candidatus Eisenbacteria bacterium]|nr:GerMN domain-containing protein [Candidatus Eisenbacteria bacterium]